MTYNVWVKPDTELDGLRTILDLNGYDNFLMGIYDAELVSYTPSYSYDSGYILEPNTWYNLAITYSNENGVVFYVNGEEVYSDTDLDGDEFVFENIGIGAGFDLEIGFDYIVETLAIQSDGKIIVGGRFSSYNGVGANRILRLNTDGSIDTSFDIGTGFDFNDWVETLAIQSDGKIIVGGGFNSYQGVAANKIVRLNTDGSRDTSFDIGTGFDSDVITLAIQSDGKIIVGGRFGLYQGELEYNEEYDYTEMVDQGGASANHIIRLNSNGSRDTSFNIGTGFDYSVNTLSIQSDGKIIVGGYFNSYQGVGVNRIVRLNTDGSRDTSFDIGTGFDDDVYTLAIQSDGKIIVGGDFESYKGVGVNRIVRLNTDGSRNISFNINTGFNDDVKAIAIQSDGKIVVGGDFISYQGVAANRIVRLNTDGSIDTSFNIGAGFSNPCSWNPSVDCGTSVNTLAIQSDGKIIVGGYFNNYQGVVANRIVRLNTDGSIDTSFDLGTGFDDGVNTLAIQSDGKIIVGGWFSSYQGVAVNRIVRLNTDGSIDTSFNIGAGFSNPCSWNPSVDCGTSVNTLAIQSDGKIIVGGWFSSYQGVGANRIIRLNINGSRDYGFNIGTGFVSPCSWNPSVDCGTSVNTLAIQSDGKIIVGGQFSSYQGVAANNIIRLNTDGSIDTSFNIGTGFDDDVYTLAIQSDGKIIVGGSFGLYQGELEYNEESDYTEMVDQGGASANKIIRLNSNGSRDTSFNIGTGFSSAVITLAIQSDGKIIVGGDFSSYQGVGANYIVRLNTDGSRDTSFNIGTGFSSAIYTLAIQSDGKIIVGGDFSSYQGVPSANKIIRLNSDGSIDTSFNIGTGFSWSVRTLAIQSDGKIIVGGRFTSYQGVVANKIIRLNTDGSRDTSFNIGTGFDDGVETLAIQSDGKIIVGGEFESYKRVGANRIVRLNTDGSLDTSFNIGTGFNSTVRTLAIQSDGKIIVGGQFTSYQGVGANRIVRLNTDGSLDTSFNIGTGFNSTVRTLAIQSDGKIIVGGSFSSYQGVGANYIVRLNTDGSLDTSFNIGTGFSSTVNTLAIQSDGKIIVGGWFGIYQGVAANYIVRLNTDGSRDTSFNIGTGFSSTVNTLAIQSDGKIIVGGLFGSYQGVAANRIIRLNTDGSIDTSFNIGTGFNSDVNTLALQDDGKIIVGGWFSSYQGVAANYIVRLNTDGSRDTSFNIGTGFNSTVRTLAIQSDGKIIVGGLFSTYRDQIANFLIRINN